MANEIRVRGDFVSGTLSASLTNVATSMSAAGLANLPVVDSTKHAAIAIENEIVWVTAHTGGATTATILRGQEGTVAAAHNSGVAWQHGPTSLDLNRAWNPPTCRVYNSANISVPHNTLTLLTFNSERWDTDSMHSTSSLTDRITFNTAGLYVVTLQVNWASSAGANRSASIFLNGITIIAQEGPHSPPSAEVENTQLTTQWKFAAGDFVNVQVYQFTGGAVNVQSQGNWSPEFMATWIGTGT